MSNRIAGLIVAGLIFVAGLVVAFLPATISPRGVDISCGSAFVSSSEAAMTDSLLGNTFGLDEQCGDKLTTRRLIAFPLIGVGALGILFCALTLNQGDRQRSAPTPTA